VGQFVATQLLHSRQRLNILHYDDALIACSIHSRTSTWDVQLHISCGFTSNVMSWWCYRDTDHTTILMPICVKNHRARSAGGPANEMPGD